MAFTGTPVLVKVTDKLWRLTGVSLAAAASGTISFSDATSPGQVTLLSPDWQAYTIDGDAAVVHLDGSVNVTAKAAGTSVHVSVPMAIVKTGTTHLDWLATITNLNASEGQPGPLLEIYIEFAGH